MRRSQGAAGRQGLRSCPPERVTGGQWQPCSQPGERHMGHQRRVHLTCALRPEKMGHGQLDSRR